MCKFVSRCNLRRRSKRCSGEVQLVIPEIPNHLAQVDLLGSCIDREGTTQVLVIIKVFSRLDLVLTELECF